MSSPTDRCALRSEAAGEDLDGTASTIRRWLLIEHAGPWGRDGLVDARLPGGLGLALRATSKRTRSRVLLIRRPGRVHGGSGTACFAVDTADSWIGSRTIARIEEATDLDAGDRLDFPERVSAPVVVVCTHGRRDVCCAERGRPLAAATASVHPDAVWESTHVGGDRFAANLVAFPHGLVFGRVGPDRGAEVVGAYAQGRIVLDRYRGRTSHPMHAQAAEIAVRRSEGLDRIDDVGLIDAHRTGDTATARFSLPGGEAVVRLVRRPLPPMRLTCGSHADEAAVTWIVESIETHAAGKLDQRGTSSSP